MYAFVDRPVESLCHGGRFLLWALRGWVHAVDRGACPPRVLGPGFAAAGALMALQDFHIAMALFRRDALVEPSFAPLGEPLICEDEAVVLSMWHDLALGRFDQISATLAHLVDEDAISPIQRAMTIASARLIAGGTDLSGMRATVTSAHD